MTDYNVYLPLFYHSLGKNIKCELKLRQDYVKTTGGVRTVRVDHRPRLPR
jgi:hypothetical protein